jgi:antitoxin (DNA-binding transcriptional repressor) of toxin-antitoxin stability system
VKAEKIRKEGARLETAGETTRDSLEQKGRAGLLVPRCDAKMHHMKTATVRDLRYHFSDIEARLNKGEEVLVRKRKKLIARLLPIEPTREVYPDFASLRTKIFGRKKSRKTGTEIVSEARGRY